MIILPAIDIKNGQCVRLFKGDFSTVEKVAEDPLATAQGFAAAGAQWIHMVDLDGALEGHLVNRDIFLTVARETELKVEIGGGIRSMDAIDFYLSSGISRVILGSAALNNPQLVAQAVGKYEERIAVGIDARNEMVQAAGWLEDSQVHYLDLAKMMENLGVQTIIYTDISRDGTLTGPNLPQLVALQNTVRCDIVASGGITNIDDIRALKAAGLYGAICGKSLYKGTLDLQTAISLAHA